MVFPFVTTVGGARSFFGALVWLVEDLLAGIFVGERRIT
jgi:hypothetical protein